MHVRHESQTRWRQDCVAREYFSIETGRLVGDCTCSIFCKHHQTSVNLHRACTILFSPNQIWYSSSPTDIVYRYWSSMAEQSILNITGGHANEDVAGSEVKASSKKEVIPGQCCIPPPFSDYQGLGTEETWSSMPVYITAPKSLTSSAVVIISDIYGWQVPQTRQLADKIAAAGHYVVVPDFMENDFFGSSDPNDEYAGLPKYLARHSKPKAIAEAKEVLKKLQAMGYNPIGGAGFCWGSKILVSLLKGDTPLAAAIMCHPSFITNDEMKEVKVPLAVLGAEIDIVTSAEQVIEYGAILHDNADVVGPESYVKIYKGAEHGWTTRYDQTDVEARNRAETAHEEVISWLKNRLGNLTAAL